VVNILIFVLGCFIDFFEIAFIVIPILAPVAEKILAGFLPEGTPPEMTLIWFGVVIAMNLQTSFLTPPFGFALFYLRSVAAKKDYKDRVTGATIPAVQTSQIYKGSIAFIILQLIMVSAVIAFPTLVTGGIEKTVQIDADKAFEQMQRETEPVAPSPPPGAEAAASKPEATASSNPIELESKEKADKEEEDDPMKALEEAVKKDAEKTKK
jgi:Tripartite ATP-independent periplasmic transporter, DctM component